MTKQGTETTARAIQEHLSELTPILQRYALGDFSQPIVVPEGQGELTELYKALKLMAGDIQALLLEKAESEHRFRSTFEQAAVGVAHVSPEGRFLRVNQRLCEMLGHSQDELLDMSFQDVTHPEDLELDLNLVQDARNRTSSRAMNWV